MNLERANIHSKIGSFINNVSYFIIIFLITGYTLFSKSFSKLNVNIMGIPVYITEISIIFIVLLCLVRIFFCDRGKLVLYNPLKIEFALFYLIFLISLIKGFFLYDDTAFILRQSALFYYSIFYFLIIITFNEIGSLLKLKYILIAFLVSSNIMLIFFILNFLNIVKMPFPGMGAAGYIYISLLFITELTCIIYLKNIFLEIIFFINMILLIVANVLYRCRGSWVAIIVAILSVYIFFKVATGLKKEFFKLNIIMLSTLAVIIIFIVLLLFYRNDLWVSIKEDIISIYHGIFSETEYVIDVRNIPAVNIKWRLITWKDMFIDVLNRPFLGYGFGKKFISETTLQMGWDTGLVDGWVESHNYLLSFLYRSGFLGLGVFLSIVIGFFKKAIKFLKSCKDKKIEIFIIGLLGCIVYILILGLFEVVLEVPYGGSLLWIIMGIVIVIINFYERTVKL